MLEIMLCGARDTTDIANAFDKVVRDFGADPWFYEDGKIHHINSRTSRWQENSRATVRRVDICVFVVLDRYGYMTWNHELQEALELGKPFVVMRSSLLGSVSRTYVTAWPTQARSHETKIVK